MSAECIKQPANGIAKIPYERYQKIRTGEEFFDDWEAEKLNGLTEKLKDYVYGRYVNKCMTLQRDNFTCQNKEKVEIGEEIYYKPCKYCKNIQFFHRLTVHHIKFKKNFKDENGNLRGDPDKVRNQVTLCAGIHHGYHKASTEVSFLQEAANLPPHIRGHTFKLEKPDQIDWKKIKSDMRKLRQEIKFKLGESIKHVPVGQRRWFTITAEQILLLFKWLYIPYYEMGEDDD